MTIVYRCEELTAGQIREATAQGALHPAQVRGHVYLLTHDNLIMDIAFKLYN